MRIEIDVREKDLIDIVKTINIMNGNYEIIIKALPIGDIIIYDDQNNERIIIERKSLYDLASSIKDGRYKEQSFRLTNCNIHNHNIIYLIEGDLNTYNEKKGRMDKNTLLSACITLNHYKGFSTWRTQSLNETASYIIQLCNKMKKMDTSENSYYDIGMTSKINETSYCEVSSAPREKKKNINENNICEIMLSCLPGVSVKSAQALLEKYGSMKNLIQAIESDDEELKNINIESTTGKTRKIGKNVLESLKKII